MESHEPHDFLLGGENTLKLEGANNWHTWKFQTKIMLKAIDAYKVIDGAFPYPDAGDEKIKWKKCDAKAQAENTLPLADKIMALKDVSFRFSSIASIRWVIISIDREFLKQTTFQNGL
ncbi:hypothetical protein ACJJTC_010148 [Scirpophaga incertulas]